MMIRLKEQQQHTIKKLTQELFNSSKVRIFGSRADVHQKGGDIDIYIQTDKKEDILKSKIIFLREFEKLFGEQKVDLLVDNGTNKSKEIFEIAKKEGIAL
jgi:predicted nucleotidyltransferase